MPFSILSSSRIISAEGESELQVLLRFSVPDIAATGVIASASGEGPSDDPTLPTSTAKKVPADAEAGDETDRQSVTLVCVLDRSGSMSDGEDPYVTKMSLLQASANKSVHPSG